jgi:predicted amidohydrolase YtcJ
MGSDPDLIVTAARLFDAPGDAVAVTSGQISAIGERAQLLRTRGARTRVVTVPGGLLSAGFHDAHTHLAATGLARLEIDLHGMSGPAVIDAVQRAAAHRAAGRWIVGRGFDPDQFPPAGSTAREALDTAAADHPILLRSHDYHCAALNTRGLRAAGFLPTPPSIDGGLIELGADGEPNGLTRELAANRAGECADDHTPEERASAVAAIIPDLFAAGLVALHDMSGSRWQQDLRALDAEGRLTIPVFATVAPEDVASAAFTAPGRRIRVTGMKAFLDGALGTRTARLLEPYEDDPAHLGIEVIGAARAHEYARAAARQGLASYLHAIGDGAVRTALDAVDGVTGPQGTPLRHRVEHAQMVHDDDLPRFARQGVIASVQPVHMAEDAAIVRRHWGARSREAFPLRRLADSGAVLAFGSDMPIETSDVLEGIRCAVQRTGRDGTELHVEEALTVAESLRAYTAGAARAVGAEHELGALRPGMRASLTALSHDIEEHPESLGDAAIALTVVDGEIVFGGDA